MPRTAQQQVQYVQAKEPATGEVNGEPFVVNPSDIFRPDHPIVRAHPNLFKPVQATRPTVEQMTAAPGERRGEPV